MEMPEDFDPLDDKWRWCVYCKADCWPEVENQEHADDCPTVTGRYPVEPNGGPSACCRCEVELKVGGFYRHICVREAGDTGDELADAPVYETVCEDCAMQVELLGAPREQ
jgi:hypothetical protein